MYRPFLITGLMIAPLLSGCGGSNEVAQSSPAASAPAPAASQSMAAPPDSAGSEGGYAPGDANYTGEPPGDAGMLAGSPDASGGMNPSMPGYGQGPGYGTDMGDASGNSAMGGMYEGGGMPMSGGGNGVAGMGMGAMGMGGMGMGEMGMGMGMGGQFVPPEDPAPSEDADYLTKGRYAFSIGKEKEAIEYALAYAIAAPEGTDVLQKTKWFATGLRPLTTARLAVGVVLEAPSALTDFKPIGSKQLQGGNGGGGRESMMGAPGAATQAKTAKAKEHAFYDLTGTFGEAVVAGFQERWTAGNFGTVFNDVEKFEPKLPVGNNGMGMGGMGMGGMPGGMAGMPGGMDSVAGMGEMGGMGMGGDGQTPAQPKIMPGSVVIPGMVYIGSSEKQADLMKKAEDRGVDLVILFDVKVSPPNRLNGIIQNQAKARVVSLKGDPLARSSDLLNTEVERAQIRASGDDEVAKATDKFLAQFDSKVKLADMPALKPEHAKARLVQLLSNAKLSKLEKLFEVSLYHSMKLITDDEKLTACLIVMEGSEGESLANGRPEDKQAVLDALLPSYK